MALSPNEGLKQVDVMAVETIVSVGMALSPNEGLKLSIPSQPRCQKRCVGMALSPNEGLKQPPLFLLPDTAAVGMALSPNEGLKRATNQPLHDDYIGGNGAKPE